MSEKINLGGGSYLEPDDNKRSRFRVAIVETKPIPGTRGVTATLACGHRVLLFGNLEMTDGRALCTVCRDAAEREKL